MNHDFSLKLEIMIAENTEMYTLLGTMSEGWCAHWVDCAEEVGEKMPPPSKKV